MEQEDKLSIEQLCVLINDKKELWVRLYDGLRICLIKKINEQEAFVGKFIPCSSNSRTYTIAYKDVKEIIGEKNGNCKTV
jgi:hypothetical protein